MIPLSPEHAKQADLYVDQQHEHYQHMGQRLFETFNYDRNSGRINTQIRNLQQIVCSAPRFADIEDFVKNQMGRDTSSAKQWRQVGDGILKELQALRKRAAEYDDQELQLAFRLRLARGWVRAVVSEYLYRIALDQMEHSHV